MPTQQVEDLAPCVFCGERPEPPSRKMVRKREQWHLRPCCQDAFLRVYRARRIQFQFDPTLDRWQEYLLPFKSRAQAVHTWNQLMREVGASRSPAG